MSDEHLQHCHICGESEVDCDLECCFACNLVVCPDCCREIEDDNGDPLGVLCDVCSELSNAMIDEKIP